MKINKSTKPGDVIETSQSLRLEIIDKLTDKGERVPTETKELGTFLQLLRDLDAAALTTRKLDVEEKSIDVASKASANVAAILKELGGNPFKKQPQTIEGTVLIPTPDTSMLPEIELVPGHTKQGADKLEYTEFVVDESGQ
jgi:hypothetical protein